MKTYTRKLLEQVDNVVRELSSKSLVLSKAINVLRLLGEESQCLLDDVLNGVVLHLDDVLSGNRLASARPEDGSFIVGDGSTKCYSRESGEKKFVTHDEWSMKSLPGALDELLLMMGQKSE
jgi:hypothetical protein